MAGQNSSEQLAKLKSAMADLQQMNGGATRSGSSKAMNSAAVNGKTQAGEQAEVKEKVMGEGTYLKVDKDEMTAWLYLTPPDKTPEYRKHDLIDYLTRKGVIKGLHQSNLSAMVKKKVYNREIVVARGIPAKQGKDGYFEYLFTPEEYNAPKIMEDGSVDYSHMSALQNVKAGDKVAVYHRAESGVDGTTVLGNSIKAKMSRDLPPLHGIGVIRENEFYYAKTDGKIEAKNGRIDIQDVHEVFDDVTMIVGKVDFLGDIIIHGNVEDGVVIRAGRNIEIYGTTAAAALYAGGDVVLSRGISGGHKAKIVAQGNVFADFIEHAEVDAGGTVQANTILNSNVYSQEKVIVMGKKGSIIGGYTHALKGMEASNTSNEVEVKTILHCGYDAASYDRLVDVKRKEQELKGRTEEVTDSLSALIREKRVLGPRVSEETELKISILSKEKDELLLDLDKVKQEKQELEEIIEQGNNAEIKIDGNVYRGTIIGVNTDQTIVDKDTRFMRYKMKKGVIESSVIV